MDTKRRTRIAPLLLLVLAATAHAQRPGASGNTCPDDCPDSGRPVCGTNNRSYRNICQLQKAACNSNIRKRNDGPCVAATSRACKKRCPSEYIPICATNGVTYGNRCKLNRASCENSNIKARYEGVCDVSANPSSSSDSAPSPPVAVPAVVRPSTLLGSSSPSGSRPSSSGNRPSSSGSRPSSSRPSVGGLVIGAPVLPIFPAGTQSNANPRPAVTSAPVVNTPRPVRNCPDNCAPGFRPVCGTDDQAYGNDCKLRVAICKNPNLRKKNDGVCKKDCSIVCPVELNYVCGTNGRTYINDCELTVARCLDPAIKKAGNGQCGIFRDAQCDVQSCERIFEPVCGSDGRTYQNTCQLRVQSCVDKSLLRLHDGECAVQRCGDVCPSIFDPVCGTDGVVYTNHCTLINTACRARSGIIKFSDGPCRPNIG